MGDYADRLRRRGSFMSTPVHHLMPTSPWAQSRLVLGPELNPGARAAPSTSSRAEPRHGRLGDSAHRLRRKRHGSCPHGCTRGCAALRAGSSSLTNQSLVTGEGDVRIDDAGVWQLSSRPGEAECFFWRRALSKGPTPSFGLPYSHSCRPHRGSSPMRTGTELLSVPRPDEHS